MCNQKRGGEKGGLVSRDSTPEKEESEKRKKEKKYKKIKKNSKTITRRVIAAGPRKRPHMRPPSYAGAFLSTARLGRGILFSNPKVEISDEILRLEWVLTSCIKDVGTPSFESGRRGKSFCLSR